MPELPEVETVARSVDRRVRGERIADVWFCSHPQSFKMPPAQQAKDRVRDQAHAAAGLTTLRFTHSQVRFEPEQVCEILVSVIARLA